jgi:hypothetical protein
MELQYTEWLQQMAHSNKHTRPKLTKKHPEWYKMAVQLAHVNGNRTVTKPGIDLYKNMKQLCWHLSIYRLLVSNTLTIDDDGEVLHISHETVRGYAKRLMHPSYAGVLNEALEEQVLLGKVGVWFSCSEHATMTAPSSDRAVIGNFQNAFALQILAFAEQIADARIAYLERTSLGHHVIADAPYQLCLVPVFLSVRHRTEVETMREIRHSLSWLSRHLTDGTPFSPPALFYATAFIQVPYVES